MRRFLLITLLVGLAGGAGYGTYAAFADTTVSSANGVSGGTVTLSANASTPVYALTGRSPGDTAERCIKVTYSGSLDASVRLYRGAFASGTGLAEYVNLTILQGSGELADCSDFTTAASIYSGTLAAFPDAYAGGLALAGAGGSGSWGQGDAVTYRITAQLQNDVQAQGLATGTHPFVWEARNQ